MVSLVKICLLTKNEYDTIEDFILFYGSLFGYENLHIIDNGSTNEHVISVYDKYKLYGINVTVDARPLNNHAEMMTEYMLKLKSQCKYIIPLDTDEFLFFTDNTPLTKENVLNYFLSLPEEVSIVRFGKFYGSTPDPSHTSYISYKHERPVRNIIHFHDQNWDKVFVRADRFHSCMTGNHSAIVTSGIRVVSDRLGLLHFHETGVYRQFERNIQAVEGRKHVSSKDPLPKQITDALTHILGIGGHHCRIYLKFITRLHLINEWKRHFGRDALPAVEDMQWVHKNSDNPDILRNISLYVNLATASGNTNENVKETDLVFSYWPELEKEFTITSVKDYLESLVVPANISVESI